MNLVEKEGFTFAFDPRACERCSGACCCGDSGKVWVNLTEIAVISSYLRINEVDFMAEYLYLEDGRYSCRERLGRQGMACIFFEEALSQCSIYAVRPTGCRTFPFWEYFREHVDQILQECPGVIVLGNG